MVAELPPEIFSCAKTVFRCRGMHHLHHWPRIPQSKIGQRLERTSSLVTNWTGSSWAFGIAALVIVAWLISGPVFHYSNSWQLVINTGTTIATFLMVFLIQR